LIWRKWKPEIAAMVRSDAVVGESGSCRSKGRGDALAGPMA
jgi:hypothetical protein